MAMLTVRPTRALPCSFSDFSAALPPGFPFCSFSPYLPTLVSPRRLRSFRCSTSSSDHHKSPPLLKSAISGLTELLRTFSPKKRRDDSGFEDAPLAGSVDDVLQILSIDYGRAYFLTGNFTSNIYANDCLFEDPTIKFTGKDQYLQNLRLLVPFFDCPSLVLQKIEKGCNNGTNFIIAKWKLRTYLKFPWRPFISITGTTTYDLNEEFHIVKHAENWNISPLEAIGQIFAPGSREVGE
ncbi:uncharacterized protein LOC110031388 isoform X1 [Phalaenopsis equestris]|uniref:uncharacterized protein LOC110031388 isoform X1 n=1 Tax=Phalaenopsis equestris TaxID=78828 RepID=UPI0009E55569|nr:uncharacterized protein LOC110031388 isoform X1 [Phalaenopsis equestris]